MEEYKVQKKHDDILHKISNVRREIRHLQYQFEYEVLDASHEEKLLSLRDTLQTLETQYSSLMDVSSKIPDVWASHEKTKKKRYKKANKLEDKVEAWFVAKEWFESSGHLILPFGPRFTVAPLQ